MNAIIETKNLSFSYRPEHRLLVNVNIAIIQGSFAGIAGPNGAGKTTLLNLLCRQLRPHKGAISIDARPIESYPVRKLARKIAIVRQEFVPVFDFTTEQIVSMARTPYMGTFGFETKADKSLIAEALEMTDIGHLASRRLTELSSGERQRVFIARAIAQATPVLLLDEPTSFLDLKHQVGIYDLLKRLQLDKNKTIVLVTHDLNLAGQYCENILLLAGDGSYHWGSAGEMLSQARVESTFGVKVAMNQTGGMKFFIPLGRFSAFVKQKGQPPN